MGLIKCNTANNLLLLLTTGESFMSNKKNSNKYNYLLSGTSILGAMVLMAATSSDVEAQDIPPNAKAGECYAKVLIPAVYQTAPSEVIVQPASNEVKEIPAEYKDVEKQVLVEEESFELDIIPAVYEEQEVRVLIQPERTVKNVVPAVYETVSEQVLVSPARVEWKKGRGPYEKIDEATGEIMCLVEIPAEYTTVEKVVLKSPAQSSEKVIPAEYKLRKKRVMKTPPQTVKKVIPAKYETITVRELVKPATFEQVAIAPKTEVIQKRQLVSKESVQWREILCETNTTPEIILELQQRLVNAGYGLGGSQPNGNFGPATQSAVSKFQKDNGLPTGGLTISTLKVLGMRS